MENKQHPQGLVLGICPSRREMQKRQGGKDEVMDGTEPRRKGNGEGREKWGNGKPAARTRPQQEDETLDGSPHRT